MDNTSINVDSFPINSDIPAINHDISQKPYSLTNPHPNSIPNNDGYVTHRPDGRPYKRPMSIKSLQSLMPPPQFGEVRNPQGARTKQKLDYKVLEGREITANDIRQTIYHAFTKVYGDYNRPATMRNLIKFAKTNTQAFLRIVSQLMPKDVEISGSLEGQETKILIIHEGPKPVEGQVIDLNEEPKANSVAKAIKDSPPVIDIQEDKRSPIIDVMCSDVVDIGV